MKNRKGRDCASRHQRGVFEVNCGLRYAMHVGAVRKNPTQGFSCVLRKGPAKFLVLMRSSFYKQSFQTLKQRSARRAGCPLLCQESGKVPDKPRPTAWSGWDA